MTTSIPSAQLPGTSALYLKYLSDVEWRQEYLDYPMNSLDDVEAVAQNKRNQVYQRDELASVLNQYMQGLATKSLSASAQKNITKILDPETCFIVTGQQPALFGGPLYNFYKAQSIIQIAKKMEQQTGKSFVPLFWVGSNDHDVEEANRSYYLDSNKRLRTTKFKFNQNIPLHLLEVADGFDDVSDSLKETVGRKDFFDQALDLVKPQASETFGTWQSRLLMDVFSDEGLLVIEPHALNHLSRNAFDELLSKESALIDAIGEQSEKLHQNEMSAQVDNDVTSRFMIYSESHDRVRLNRQGDLWEADGKTYTQKELLDLNGQNIIELTPDALGRPLWQDLIFPTAAYIGGPGEIAYFHQLKSAYECLDLKMPVILPRISATFFEASQIKYLNKLDISLDEFTTLSGLREVPLGEPYPDFGVSEILEHWGASVKFSAGKDELDKFAKKLHDLNNRFYRTVENLRLKENGIGNKQLDEFKDFIFPLSGLQERSIGLLQMISKHGESIVDEIKQLDYQFGQHQLIVLG